MFLRLRAAPLGPWGVAGCVFVLSAVCGDFCAPSATHAGLVAKRHMAQSQADAKLNLKIWIANGAARYFRVKKSTEFREILAAFAASGAGIDPDTIHMTVDGQRVNPEECPGDYEMKDGDEIYCRRDIHAQRPRYEAQNGEIFGRLVPKRRRELPTQEPTASDEASGGIQHPRLSHVLTAEMIAGRSLPPGGLSPELLHTLLEFLTLDKAHEVKRVSLRLRRAACSAITRGRLKPVKFISELVVMRGYVPVHAIDATEAWKVDPNETLRILFTWGFSEAARFLAIVEKSLDGLERIVRLCEPAHRFVYATHQLNWWWHGGDPRGDATATTIDVIRQWAAYIGTPVDMPSLASLPVERRNLVLTSVFGALGSWADAAVAADFFFCFFSGDDWETNMEIPVPDLRETRDWDGGKASAFAAAYVAHVAALRHGFDYSPYEFGEDGFSDAADRIEELIHLEERLGEEEFDARAASFGMSWQNGITKLVEHASEFPGKFYDLY